MNGAYDVVVPTVGRRSLTRLLDSLARHAWPAPGDVIVVDDRRHPDGPLDLGDAAVSLPVTVVHGRAAGPAAARNDGVAATTAPWVVFLDDDVEVLAGWGEDLRFDLGGAGPDVGAVQGRVQVPLPPDRRPRDWERNVAGLARARWITADLAVRRAALAGVGGFDERFPRAYREDADLALRLRRAGWQLRTGVRGVEHAIRPAPWWVSIGKQLGNADDALMRRLHGSRWRELAGVPAGRRRRHVAATLALAAGVAGAGRAPRVARTGALVYGALVAELASARLARGPRDVREVATVLTTSVVLPVAATLAYAGGAVRARHLTRRRSGPAQRDIDAVLVDRDGTLVHDVPYNGDPAAVRPVTDARAALDRLRAQGLRVAVVTNQSGIGRGLLDPDQVEAVNRRVEQLLGPFDAWVVCPHGPADGCTCRKPRPGIVERAAAVLGVPPERCAVVGDIGADVVAARRAGAWGVLVPTPATRREEVEAASDVAPSLGAAVDLVLAARGAR